MDSRQYNLQYDGTPAEDCPKSKQSATQDQNTICRNTPSNTLEASQEIEKPCLFPFYYDDQLYDSCVLFDQNDFVLPIFRCPYRDIKRKYPGTDINWFKSDDLESILTGGFCPLDYDGANNLPVLDPDDNSCLSSQRRVAFSQCKNDCPGGKFCH